MADSVTPVQKVIEMLTSMQDKAKAEKEEEVKIHAKYQQWCHNSGLEKEYAIKKGAASMEELTASIAKDKDTADKLGRDVEELDGEISQAESDVKAATEQRVREHDEFVAAEQNFAESIDAMDRAIKKLKDNDFARGQASALIKQTATVVRMVPQQRWTAILESLESNKAFLQLKLPVDERTGAPAVAGYKSTLGPIIQMLVEMEEQMGKDKGELEKEEANAQHSFEMQVMDLTDQIENDKRIRAQKVAARGDAKQSAAKSQGDLDAVTLAHADDTKYLKDMEAQCSQRSHEFEGRQATRAGEIEAIDKAVEILSSKDVLGASDKHFGTVLSQKATSFVQLASAHRSRNAPEGVQRVYELLQGTATKLKSRTLALAAAEVAAGTNDGTKDDPMAKVKQMISDLVDRLQEEAAAEADHHAWCNTELHDNKVTRDEKTAEVEQLSAKSDELAASISKLKEQVTELAQEIKELDDSMAKATADRKEEKAKNEATIADAKAAAVAVENALQVLKEFYAKSGQATVLVQQPSEDAPPAWNKPYTGQQAESGGVIGMLEVIASDFDRLDSETSADERSAEAAYEKFMRDTGGCIYHEGVEVCGSKAEKEELSGKKDHLAAMQTAEKHRTDEDLRASQEQLDDANNYYDKLKPDCISPDVSVEERVQKREEEIQSLQEALDILSE